MNDAELDRLLDTWETPLCPPRYGSGCWRFRGPNGGASSPRCDGLVAAAASVTLAIAWGRAARMPGTSAWSASCMTSTIVSSELPKPGTQPSSCRRSARRTQGVCGWRIGWAVEFGPAPQWTCRCRRRHILDQCVCESLNGWVKAAIFATTRSNFRRRQTGPH